MRFLTRRIVFYLITAWAAVTLNFIIPRLMPGNPAETLMARFQGRLSPTALTSLTRLFGLDTHTSLLEQYFQYWRQLFHGDLGISFSYFPEPVSSVIGTSMPWTAVLIGVSTVVGFILGTMAGVVIGWRRGSRMDTWLPHSVRSSLRWRCVHAMTQCRDRIPELIAPPGEATHQVACLLHEGAGLSSVQEELAGQS